MSKSQNPTKEVIPIMKKRIYRRMPVNDFQPDTVSHADLGGKLIFAIDVAKVDMVAALAAADGRVLHTICWKAPEQNPTVLSILRSFRAAGVTVEAVMEGRSHLCGRRRTPTRKRRRRHDGGPTPDLDAIAERKRRPTSRCSD
jgi:hypothetical protein